VLYGRKGVAGRLQPTLHKPGAALQGIDGVQACADRAEERVNAYAVPFQSARQAWTGSHSTLVRTARLPSSTRHTTTRTPTSAAPAPSRVRQRKAHDSEAPDPALFPAQGGRGTDFVGDTYNPDPAADPNGGISYPADPPARLEPADCVGHGSHVAGSAAGLGENANGSTYAGTYNTSPRSTR